jgi:hypothetical protein
MRIGTEGKAVLTRPGRVFVCCGMKGLRRLRPPAPPTCRMTARPSKAAVLLECAASDPVNRLRGRRRPLVWMPSDGRIERRPGVSAGTGRRPSARPGSSPPATLPASTLSSRASSPKPAERPSERVAVREATMNDLHLFSNYPAAVRPMCAQASHGSARSAPADGGIFDGDR